MKWIFVPWYLLPADAVHDDISSSATAATATLQTPQDSQAAYACWRNRALLRRDHARNISVAWYYIRCTCWRRWWTNMRRKQRGWWAIVQGENCACFVQVWTTSLWTQVSLFSETTSQTSFFCLLYVCTRAWCVLVCILALCGCVYAMCLCACCMCPCAHVCVSISCLYGIVVRGIHRCTPFSMRSPTAARSVQCCISCRGTAIRHQRTPVSDD